MRLISNHVFVLCFLFGLLAFSSCRREIEAPEVENEILTPLVKSSLNISNLVADSLYEEDAEGHVSLVYRNELYSASLDAFDELNTREFEKSAKLEQLKLSDRVVENSVSLGQITAGGPYEGLILFAHNSGNPYQIPAINNQSFGPEELDGSAYFDELTLDSGFMEITIANGFPTSISTVNFEIRNRDNNALIAQETFDTVYANDFETRIVDLAGKSMESYMEANVINFNIDASDGPVPIDTADKIIVTVLLRDMKVYSAKAVFPAQNIIEVSEINAMESVGSTRVTRAIAKSGFVNVEVESTIEDTLYFEYNIPEALKDGQPFIVKESIPPAPPGGSNDLVFNYDVAGYEFGMTGFPIKDSFNVFYSELVGRIDSTGKKVNITLEDSIRIKVNLSGFVPEYMEGYAGDTIVSFGPETVPLELFQKISAGSLKFSDVNMGLSVTNGNGVPIDVEIGSLVALNSTSGENITIDLSSLPNPISVLGASSISEPWTKSWSIDDESNLSDALSIFPDQFQAAMTIKTNPEQNNEDLTQFGVDSNELAAYVDIEIPLEFVAENLTMRDTIEFNASNIEDPAGVKSGVLYVTANNSFPLSADMQLQFMAVDGSISETLKFDRAIGAGALNTPKKTVLAWEFNRETFDDMLESEYMVLTAIVSTSSTTEPIKVYSTMELDLKLSARFNYIYNLK